MIILQPFYCKSWLQQGDKEEIKGEVKGGKIEWSIIRQSRREIEVSSSFYLTYSLGADMIRTAIYPI